MCYDFEMSEQNAHALPRLPSCQKSLWSHLPLDYSLVDAHHVRHGAVQRLLNLHCYISFDSSLHSASYTNSNHSIISTPSFCSPKCPPYVAPFSALQRSHQAARSQPKLCSAIPNFQLWRTACHFALGQFNTMPCSCPIAVDWSPMIAIIASSNSIHDCFDYWPLFLENQTFLFLN